MDGKKVRHCLRRISNYLNRTLFIPSGSLSSPLLSLSLSLSVCVMRMTLSSSGSLIQKSEEISQMCWYTDTDDDILVKVVIDDTVVDIRIVVICVFLETKFKKNEAGLVTIIWLILFDFLQNQKGEGVDTLNESKGGFA